MLQCHLLLGNRVVRNLPDGARSEPNDPCNANLTKNSAAGEQLNKTNHVAIAGKYGVRVRLVAVYMES